MTTEHENANLETTILQAVARGWCSDENAGKEVDATLAEAITREVLASLRHSQAGGAVGEVSVSYDDVPPLTFGALTDQSLPVGTKLYAHPPTPASEAVRVDDAMVERFCNAFYDKFHAGHMQPDVARKLLAAAIAEPVLNDPALDRQLSKAVERFNELPAAIKGDTATPAGEAVREKAIRELAAHLRNGGWDLRSPQELADMIASALDKIATAAIAEPVGDALPDGVRESTEGPDYWRGYLAGRATPAGDFVMVPREPTEAMTDAAYKACARFGINDCAVHLWDAMLAAAPKDGGS